MVYCGKPSRGCEACRVKKTRCDRLVPSCSQCIRAHRTCPGYRNQLDLMFRNENQIVMEKSKVREIPKSNSKSSSATSSPPSTSAITSIEDMDRATLEMEIAKYSRYQFGKQGLLVSAKIPTFTISPPVEQLASCYFRANSSMWLQNFDLLDGLCGQTHGDDHLSASLSALSFASFANSVHAPGLLSRARKDYITALQLTNAALRSPTEVGKDKTLFAVIILSIFETVAGSNERSLSAWAEHVNGAAALLKLRGPKQFQTEAGQRLFFQAMSNIITSCIQRSLPMPEHIVELRREAKQFIDTSNQAWLVSDIIVDYTIFRAALRDANCGGPRMIVEAALDIDRRFLESFEDIPEAWVYRTVSTEKHPRLVWNKIYHIYQDSWIAQLWNATRICRILLHGAIRAQLLLDSCAVTPIFTDEEYATQSESSSNAILELEAELLASIPQYIPSNINNLSPSLIEGSRGHFVLWPLYLVGVMDLTTEPMRQWVICRLRSIGDEVGIKQATVLADSLAQRRDITVWEAKRPLSLGTSGAGQYWEDGS